MAENTYTYTARSADTPDQGITFTLSDDYLYIGTSVPVEHVERAVLASQAEEGEEGQAEGGEEGGAQLRAVLKPLAVSAIERSTHPFSVGDVYAKVEKGNLRLTAWVRISGMRVAPVLFSLAHVDNPDAARLFVEELDRRRAAVAYPGRFPGILDYWASWIVGGFSAFLLLIFWLRGRYKDAA